MNKSTVYQMLASVEAQQTKEAKINKLRSMSGPTIKTVLGHTFDPGVKWLLPEGTPPYRKLRSNDEVEVKFVAELRRLYLFIAGPLPAQRNLKQRRREELFIELLESIDQRDAEVLIGMKDGKLPFPSITRELVAEAFPTLSKNW